MWRGSFWTLGRWSVIWYLRAACSRFLAVHRRDGFGDEVFEDLFPSGRGHRSIPASVMASILVFQTRHDLSDRETAEAAGCDLRWKVATEMALDHAGFDPSTLVYWRNRLASAGTRQECLNRECDKPAWATGPAASAILRPQLLSLARMHVDGLTSLIAVCAVLGAPTTRATLQPYDTEGDRGAVMAKLCCSSLHPGRSSCCAGLTEQPRWPTPELSGKLFHGLRRQPKELTWQQSSSSPADLPAFYAAIVEALGCSCQPAPG